MNSINQSLKIGAICLSFSTGMVFRSSYTGSQGMLGLCFNGIFLIFVWIFWLWAYKRTKANAKPELTDAQKLASGLSITDNARTEDSHR